MGKKKRNKKLLLDYRYFCSSFLSPCRESHFFDRHEATLDLSKWYAQEHVILCLLPAFLLRA